MWECVIGIGEGGPSMYLLFLEDAMYIHISRPLLRHTWCQSRAWHILGCFINIYWINVSFFLNVAFLVFFPWQIFAYISRSNLKATSLWFPFLFCFSRIKYFMCVLLHSYNSIYYATLVFVLSVFFIIIKGM